MSIDFTKLSAVFKPEDIEWRIGRAGKNTNGIWATCLAYVTNRAIMERLDEVCGPANWKNEYKEFTVGAAKGTICGISIRNGDEWITKWDGADPSETEAFKGGLSDSMKRAAVQWGIGRYLYKLEEGFAKTFDKQNKPKDARYGKLPKKEGGTPFYWVPPALPKWAGGTQQQAPDDIPDSQLAKDPDEAEAHDRREQATEEISKPVEKKQPTVEQAMEHLTNCEDSTALQTVWERLKTYQWKEEDLKAITECKTNMLNKLIKNNYPQA